MKKYINILLKIVISIIIMICSTRKISFTDVKEIFLLINLKTIFFAIGVYLFSVVLNAIKWKVLLPSTKLSFLVFLTFRAQLFSTILPGQLFGEASKLTLWKKQNEDVANATASVIFDKITGIISQVIVIMLGFIASKNVLGTKNIAYVFACGALLFALIFFSTEVHVKQKVNHVIEYIRHKNNDVGSRLVTFYSTWCQYSRENSTVAQSVGWGVVNQMLGVIIAYIVSKSLNLDIGYFDYCWIMSIVSFVLLIPISYAGIGLRDASLLSILSLFGASSVHAVAISSVYLICQLVAAIIGGVLCIVYNVKKR